MRAGLNQVVDPTRPQTVSGAKSMTSVLVYLEAEIRAGRFVPKAVQPEAFGRVMHRRYQQMAGGLPVWEAKSSSICGMARPNPATANTISCRRPSIRRRSWTRTQALQAFESGVNESGLEIDIERSGLVIYPLSETEFRLAHKLWIRNPKKPLFNETAFVDAASGAILLHFSNIQYGDLTIGLGSASAGTP